MFTAQTEVTMNPPDIEPDLEKTIDSPVSAPLRFTYPSGSRPLEGYQIKRGVGRGGFGEVYFAVSDAGKEVALKLIRRNLDVELRGVTQCLNLKHHNLVALYDIRNDEHDDRWVVMEYVSGESLEDVIDRHPDGMPIDLAMHWFEGIAAGVAYLHDHGIVHRDLKPANIFIDENVVKIGDYGLSKFISCSRRSGQTESVGTVHYMAPEIANGRYGKEIDTYALGIILYEMLTGHVPFEGESVGEVLMKHLTAEPDLSVLDEPYREVVRAAMTKDPDTRVKNVAEMIGRLPEAKPIPRFPTAAEATAAAATAAKVNRSANATASKADTDDEPILATIRDCWHNAETSFRESNFHPILKAIFALSAIVALVGLSEIWIPTLFTLAFSYLVYRAIRAIVSPASSSQRESAAQLASTGSQATNSPGRVPTPDELGAPVKQSKRQYARRRRQSWQEQLNKHVAAKSWRDRGSELLGSMIVAAVVASLLSVLGCAAVSSAMSLEFYLWVAIVATVGSWAIMIPCKLSEGHVEDQAPLRVSLLIAGMLVGMLAFGCATALDISLPVSREIGIHPSDTLAGEVLKVGSDAGLRTSFNNGVVPVHLPAMTAYFAFLFVTLRWWRNAEYTRVDRVSFWSIVTTIVAAFLMTFIWWFPQPLGAVLAGIMALSVQLSSPWMPPSKRREMAEQGVV